MNIYFSGIGGVGIGPLAEMALDAGYEVSGSDPKESLITQQLKQRGVVINSSQDGSYLKSYHEANPIDWFVHTSALAEDHPELVLAKRLGIKTAKRDELIAQIIKDKDLKLIAIAGTHGKTTTTGMVIWTLQHLNIPVSYSIGTTISFGPSGKINSSSEYFIYECDEFDRNFLHFNPYLSLVTSIDYDHPDTYPTEDEYKTAFHQFINQSESVIMWQSDADYVGDHCQNTWLLQPEETLPLNLAGEHNRRNATLVLKALEKLGIGEKSTNCQAIETFPGTTRRFEKLADNLYSDYGHHPIEIEATLQMASELSKHVVLVYQPHQNIRQHEIRGQYYDQFEKADEVYWLPTYLSREDPSIPILEPQDLIQNLTNKDRVHLAELDDSLWQTLQNTRAKGKLVICMGAGSIDDWTRNKISSTEQPDPKLLDSVDHHQMHLLT